MADTAATLTDGRHARGRGRQDSAPAPGAPRDTDVIDRLLTQAVALGASDLHIEPMPEGAVRIRVRVDGKGMDIADAVRTVNGETRRIDPFPVALLSQLRGRIASRSGFDLDENQPQDGAMDEPIPARVATVPTVDGPLMVLRLFPEDELHRLEWMSKRDETVWQEMMTGRGGLILVSGPTGSGKSTTVFNALETYIADGKFVSTIEDPVEYRLVGARQSPVTQRAGFAEQLRGTARTDSDVIFVGEMRDVETLDTVITAANRGRTVFSTVHAIDAASTPASLEALGADMRKLANVIGGIVAQRLLRRVCERCQGSGHSEHGGDCTLCHGTTYYGRVAVREVIKISEPIRQAIRVNASPAEIFKIAEGEGTTTMAAYAKQLVTDGITTEAEVKENIG